MGRLSIELPEDQHKKIKALAALHGLSLKDYIIEKTISVVADVKENDEVKAFKEFMEILAPRIESARQGKVSNSSIEEIIKKAKSQRRS